MKVDAGVDRGAEGGERVVLADLAPVGAELPGAQPDHADVASHPAKAAILHGR